MKSYRLNFSWWCNEDLTFICEWLKTKLHGNGIGRSSYNGGTIRRWTISNSRIVIDTIYLID